MRIYQQPLDEHTLWNHLQTGEFKRAIEIIDWYYSRTNPEGFDDPIGITKVEHLEPTKRTGSACYFLLLFCFAEAMRR